MQGDIILFRINSTLIYTHEEQESLRALNFSERLGQVDPQNITLNFKTKLSALDLTNITIITKDKQ